MAKHTCDRNGMAQCVPCMHWRNELWNHINEYVVACGGDPSKRVYGNTPRMKAVVDVESVVIRACSNDEVR